MSGKSTFLDGLRVWFNHDLPKDGEVRKDVQARAEKRFLSGDADVSVEVHSPCSPTAPYNERWPALFYAQRELQKAVRDQETRRQILYRLIPSETPGLIQRDQQLNQLDQHLDKLVGTVESCRKKLEEAEEDSRRVQAAKEALQRFTAAGIDKLIEAQADSGRLKVIDDTIVTIDEGVSELKSETESLSSANIINAAIKAALNGEIGDTSYDDAFGKYKDALSNINEAIDIMQKRVTKAQEVAVQHIAEVRAAVQKALVDAGGTAEELNQFDALTELAGEYEKVQGQRAKAREEFSNLFRQFARAHSTRAEVLVEQREAMNRVAETVKDRFPDRIRVRVDDGGVFDSLERWFLDLKESGVTRWWNNRVSSLQCPISPNRLRRAFNRGQLSSLGMSDLVANTFAGLMTSKRRLELAALRSADKYSIELKVGVGPNDYRDIDELSGGAQVSVLLSLVLETEDTTPLIVDQPEDEMDKAYLFDVLLPALRRLKGRRQVIFATHDANIVVNGDADQVIFLKADFERGHVAEQGAIEETKVKDAIVDTLDGGRDAFSLRQVKYGF